VSAAQELVSHEEHIAPAATENTAIIQMIERAALNPAVDIDKMERLLAMQERVIDRNAKGAFTSALAQMQPKLPVITERGQISTDKGATVQSTFAKWEDINDAIRPLLAEYGFALNFRIKRTDAIVAVTGVLSHREGHSDETTIELSVDSSGNKNGVQAVGSSISYGKRYAAVALLNITSRAPQDRDDDGQAGGDPEWISADEVSELLALIEDVGADRGRFLDYLKIDTLSRLPKKRLAGAIKSLEAKRAR